jgi:putative Holliday junction resolvase
VAGPDLPVELHDERLTTVTAQRALKDGRCGGAIAARVVDKVAAAVMLQSYLERRGGSSDQR